MKSRLDFLYIEVKSDDSIMVRELCKQIVYELDRGKTVQIKINGKNTLISLKNKEIVFE